MNTQEIVIDDEVMERLRETSIKKGKSLDVLVNNYLTIVEMGRQAKLGNYKTDTSKMSPSLAALCSMDDGVQVPDDYDWRKDVEEEMYQKYMEVR